MKLTHFLNGISALILINYRWVKGYEVKIRGPNQGLGPIPASKKWGSGTDPRVQKIMLWDQSLRLLVLWSQNSIFLVLGFDPRTRNCYLWDQMLSSNTISSPCGELMGLRPMLLPNLTQNKEVEDDLKLLTLVLNNQILCSNTGPKAPCRG